MSEPMLSPAEIVAQWLASDPATSRNPEDCLPHAEKIVEAIEVVGYVITRMPIPMRLPCPECGAFHLDEGEFATRSHYTHACQGCGMVWRPAVVPTVGVRFLPGFRNEESEG